MNELHELKETLCKELKEYGKRGDLSAGSLDVIDKLAHAVKNLDRIMAMQDDDGYSGRYYPMDGSYRVSYDRRRDSMGRYSRDGYARDYRYSRDGGMADELRELMHEAKDERTRQEFKRFIDKIESM